jgi:hypothetical protein
MKKEQVARQLLWWGSLGSIVNLRFDWVAESVQEVLNLACLLSYGIKRARVIRRVSSTGTAKVVLI